MNQRAQELHLGVLRVDDEALDQRNLPLLAAQPALRLVEQTLQLARLPRDAGDRDPGALPQVVVVDLGHRRSDAILELRLRGAQVMPLLLERMRLRKVQLARENSDIAACHWRKA